MNVEHWSLLYFAYILITYSRFGKGAIDRWILRGGGAFTLIMLIAQLGTFWIVSALAMMLMIGGFPGLSVCVPDEQKPRVFLENVVGLVIVIVLSRVF